VIIQFYSSKANWKSADSQADYLLDNYYYSQTFGKVNNFSD